MTDTAQSMPGWSNAHHGRANIFRDIGGLWMTCSIKASWSMAGFMPVNSIQRTMAARTIMGIDLTPVTGLNGAVMAPLNIAAITGLSM